MKPKKVKTYTSLAPLYDTLMADVDYETWSDFIDEILQTHHPKPVDILELACGTGALSLSLAELDCYKLTATDRSPEMVEIAQKKAEEQQADIAFQTLDFTDLDIDRKFDAIFSVFDSVNYLHSEEEILTMLNTSLDILNPGGLLVYDFSTPKNSLEAVNYLNNEEGMVGSYRYFRTSRYDTANKIHYNEFEIEELDEDGKTVIAQYEETHRQRIYTLKEMLSIVEQTPYHLVAKYEGFDLVDADENSTRVTMVLRCPKQQ